MGRLACRSCGHEWEDDALLDEGFRSWCVGCGNRYYVLADPSSAPPDDGREWVDEEPVGCLACGARVTRLGEPPCVRCGKTDFRSVPSS